MGIKIEFNGNPISNLSEWQNLVYTGIKKKEWKKGSSAYSLADYIINQNGVEEIRTQIARIVNEDVTFEKGCPDYEAHFDDYGRGRAHDLAIWGTTQSGKKLFLGIEAKVNESFGDTIETAYLNAKINSEIFDKSNGKKRIEGLLAFNFGEDNKDDYQLRYQLLFSTAGTLCVEADIHIMLILVFKTHSFNKNKVKSNYNELQKFLKRTDAKESEKDIFQLTLDNKELILIYKKIALQ
ncbi:MAG: hypothetical protein WCR36_06475 [Bacteroidaceae bacterium]